MITKNLSKITELLTLENVKDSFSMANTFALATTENMVTKGIDTIFIWQNKTDSVIKKGLEFNASKQEAVFNALDSGKATLLKNYTTVVKKITKK